jgi:hypothetical protein
VSSASLAITVPTPISTSTSTEPHNNSMSGGNITSSGYEPNRTLIITLSTVLSVVGLLVIGIAVWCCCRGRQSRLPFLARGITPIDDEEIESWKANRPNEKAPGALDRFTSAGTVRKPPSVIVYQNRDNTRQSGEHSPKSFVGGYKQSLEMPQTPALARAPNARPGLTDETVEGDQAFIPSRRRHPSRLSKLPPTTPRHARTRSSRSSISVGSWRDQWYHHHTDVELSPRTSNEYYYPRTSQSYDRRHHRVYSSSSNPPRLSLDDDFFVGGLSPRPLIRQSDIGRAIG